MNMALLDLLRGATNRYLSTDELGQRLNMTPAHVLQDLDELERFGFGIQRAPHSGIRYTSPARRLCPDQIEWRLDTGIIGRRISVWRRLTSTNDMAARASGSSSNEGLVVLTDEQTAGRGRRNRYWFAPPERSILMSVLLFPPEPAHDRTLLTCMAAVAVAELLIEQLQLPARIKWPNDVRVAGLKICGVLVEELARRPRLPRIGPNSATPTAGPKSATVVGIGVNVNIARDEFPPELANTAGSLMQLCEQPLDRSELARALIQQLDRHYRCALRGDGELICRRWRDLADLLGSRVRVERAGGSVSGKLLDLWPNRGITLETRPGELEHLESGEVLSLNELPPSDH